MTGFAKSPVSERDKDVLADFEMAMRGVPEGQTNMGAAIVGLKKAAVEARNERDALEQMIEHLWHSNPSEIHEDYYITAAHELVMKRQGRNVKPEIGFHHEEPRDPSIPQAPQSVHDNPCPHCGHMGHTGLVGGSIWCRECYQVIWTPAPEEVS